MEFTNNLQLYKPRKTDTKQATLDELANNADKIETPLLDVIRKTDGVIPVEKYGAVGDGIADDTTAIQNAINAVQGTSNTLKLTGGKTYKILSTLNVTADLDIKCEGKARAIIQTPDQSFIPINATGSNVGSTTLRTSATINTKYVNVDDPTLIKPGMLITLISSKSWYHDPRPTETDARKAELHLVDEVDVPNKRVYLTDPLFDGYDLSKETVTIQFYNPIKFNMKNVVVKLTPPDTPTDSIRKTGVLLEYTIDSILKNIRVENAEDVGISVKHSYLPKVSGGKTKGSNNYYSGYGIQVVGCTHATILGRYMTNCRRGVDVSGAQIPSHLTLVDGCSHFGSGLNSMGERYGFNDDHSAGAAVFGFGTHGPADHTIFRNNRMGFVHVGINDRARNTVIEGNYFLGDFKEACITISYGENTQVLNNYTYDGFSGAKERGIFDGGANINTRKPEVFVRIYDTALVLGSTSTDNYYRIEGNYAMVQKTFVDMYGDAGGPAIPTIKNLVVKNNHVFFSPQNTSDVCAIIRNSTVTTANILLSGSTIKENNYERNSTGQIKYYDNVDPRNASEIEGVKTYSFYITDDSVASVNLGNINVNYARVGVDCTGANGLLRVTQGVTTTNTWGTLTNVTATSGVLTGTTGTDTTLNLSLQDGTLYVENRLGSTQRILVTVFAVI